MFSVCVSKRRLFTHFLSISSLTVNSYSQLFLLLLQRTSPWPLTLPAKPRSMAECSLDHPSEQLDLPVQDSNPTELEHYDLVIDGTGFTAAIVACAASRSGKTVLHIDSNNYYGGSSGSFPLEDFQAWCRGAISSKLLSETFTSNEGEEVEQHRSIATLQRFSIEGRKVNVIVIFNNF